MLVIVEAGLAVVGADALEFRLVDYCRGFPMSVRVATTASQGAGIDRFIGQCLGFGVQIRNHSPTRVENCCFGSILDSPNYYSWHGK